MAERKSKGKKREREPEQRIKSKLEPPEKKIKVDDEAVKLRARVQELESKLQKTTDELVEARNTFWVVSGSYYEGDFSAVPYQGYELAFHVFATEVENNEGLTQVYLLHAPFVMQGEFGFMPQTVKHFFHPGKTRPVCPCKECEQIRKEEKREEQGDDSGSD
jgi:hypothetical protein